MHIVQSKEAVKVVKEPKKGKIMTKIRQPLRYAATKELRKQWMVHHLVGEFT